jgi:hypothetical protein
LLFPIGLAQFCLQHLSSWAAWHIGNEIDAFGTFHRTEALPDERNQFCRRGGEKWTPSLGQPDSDFKV